MSRVPQSSSPARSSSLTSTLLKVEVMIWGARIRYPQASKNLEHWLNGHGKALSIPVQDFASQRFVIEHLISVHRPQFIDGARHRLASGDVVRGRPFVMQYYDSVTAPVHSDWYYAFGGFQVESQVSVDVNVKESSSFDLRFLTWNSRMRPYEYHWKPGIQGPAIPFLGRVTGEEMLALERAGKSQSFSYSSDWAAITDPQVVASTTIDISSLAR